MKQYERKIIYHTSEKYDLGPTIRSIDIEHPDWRIIHIESEKDKNHFTYTFILEREKESKKSWWKR